MKEIPPPVLLPIERLTERIDILLLGRPGPPTEQKGNHRGAKVEGTLRTKVSTKPLRQTMSTDKIDPNKKDATISSADDLVKTTKSGDVELSEEELKRVSGGTPQKGSDKPVETLSLNFTKIQYE